MAITIEIIASNTIPGQYPVRLYKNGKNYRVVYGGEAKDFQSHESLEAVEYYGQCLHHQLELSGRLD